MDERQIQTIQNPEQHQDEKSDQRQNVEKSQEPVSDEKKYPPFKAVLPAMVAIYLALFLVALVIPFNRHAMGNVLMISQGSNYHRHGNTDNLERLQQLWRYCLV